MFIFAYFLSIRKRWFFFSISYFNVENWLKCPSAQNLPKDCEGRNRSYSNKLHAPKTVKKNSGKKSVDEKSVILVNFLSSRKRCFTLFISYFNVENWLNCPCDQNLSKKKREGRNRSYSNIVHVHKTVQKNSGKKVRFDVELLEFCENDGSSKSWRF